MRLIIGLAFLLLGCGQKVTPENPMSSILDVTVQGKTGWSASGRLTIGGRNKGIKLQKEFPRSEVYTVAFSVQGFVEGAGNPNIVADINWKVAGNNVLRRISVMNGTAISGVAEAVEVRVRDESLSLTGRSYVVNIMVAKGSRGENMQPPIYIPILTRSTGAEAVGNIIVAPNDVELVSVPVDIGIISVHTVATWNDASDPTPINNSDLVLRQFSSTGLKQYNAQNSGWVPIVSNIQSLNFFNNTAAPAAGAVFAIAYGIEG
jgi:hypothetical protein